MPATKNELIERRHSELKDAFLAFGSVSEQLSGAFESLQTHVAELRADLRVAEAGKAQLAARLCALIRGLPGGVLVLSAGEKILEFNPAAAELLGEPLAGQSFTAVWARTAVRSGENTELRSGRVINVSRRSLHDGNEVVLLTDVTESHRLQIFLSRQQRLVTLGELAAGLAHQIRTPLAAALLYASQITLPARNPHDLARCADKTVASLKQLDALVNDMLAFAQGGAARERVSVSALLEQVAQWLRPALRDGARLTIRTQAPGLMIRANAPSLVSVLLNLATNALQAGGAPLHLQMLARYSPQGRAQIVVSDDGPGVPEELRTRIFEPYFTTRTRGTGIGLSIVKSVVAAHGGTVDLADSAQGATFVIELAAEKLAAEETP